MRPTGIRVGRALAHRISVLAAQGYLPPLLQAMIEALRASGYVFVVLGLRVENRTVVDFPEFCEEVIELLAREAGRIVVIVDGQNSSESGFDYRVTLQEAAKGSPLEIEQQIVDRLRRRFAARADVIVLSTVGTPVLCSIAACDVADFFVTPWGAGLAKYRWISNLPGLALAGPSCERFQPIHLYDDPKFIEDPNPIYFMKPGTVADAPDSEVLFSGGNADRVNIRVGKRALEARLREMLKDLQLGRI